MNLIQGDDVIIFEDEVLMYNSIFYFNDSDDNEKERKRNLEGHYLYNVADDTLVKTDMNKLENKYYIKRFDMENGEDRDREYIDCAYLDENNI